MILQVHSYFTITPGEISSLRRSYSERDEEFQNKEVLELRCKKLKNGCRETGNHTDNIAVLTPQMELCLVAMPFLVVMSPSSSPLSDTLLEICIVDGLNTAQAVPNLWCNDHGSSRHSTVSKQCQI
eukprot:Gb_31869 [translate_table: standard]